MNSFRSVERAIALRDRAPGPRARRRRAAHDGDPRLGRRPPGDLPHAVQGDVGRLPLLPGARPAAAPRRRVVDRGGPGRRSRSCPRRGERATRRSASPDYDAAVIVADPGMTVAFEAISRGGAGRCPRRRSRTSSPGAHARAAKATGLNAHGTAGAVDAGRDRDAPRRDRRGSASRARSGRELLERHLADGTPADDLLAGAGPGPISDDAALLGHVDAVIAANPKAVEDYRAGKPVDRVLRRPGDEGDRRRGRRRPGHAARQATASREAPEAWPSSRLAAHRGGVALIVVGAIRARGPYQRYMALKDQDANIARYEAWRGGVAVATPRPAPRSRWRCSAARPRSGPGSRSRASSWW